MGCGGLLACGSLRSVFFSKAGDGGYKITSDTLRTKNMAVQTGPFLEDSQIHFLLFASLKATFADFFFRIFRFPGKAQSAKGQSQGLQGGIWPDGVLIPTFSNQTLILKNLADVPISMESMVNSNFSFIVLFEENRILDLLTSLRVVLELAGKSGATVLRTQ